MKIFNFLKSHNLFVFGLIFSFCLCFIRPVYSSADDSLPGNFRFGYTLLDGTPDYFENDQPLNLFQYVAAGAEQSGSSLFDRSFFESFIRTYGLGDYFVNWNPYNPLFYCNVYIYSNPNLNSGSTCYVVDFRKSSFSDFDYSTTVFSNQVLVSNNLGFPAIFSPSSSEKFFLSLPTNFYIDYGIHSLNNPFYCSNTVGSGSFSSAGSVYPWVFHRVDSTLVSSFETFLSSSDISSFTFWFFNTNESPVRAFYFYNLSFSLSVQFNFLQCIFSSFYVYRFDSPVYYNTVSDLASKIYFYIPSDSDPTSIYDTLDYFTQGLQFISSGGLPTPTPIPSPEWITPTPLPTVTPVPITLTPIPQYINPDLDIDSTEVKSALSGYLDIIDDTFSNFAIFALGSQVLSYLYSFSSYFSFVLLIPAICLIAYAIGRLNQK